MNADGTRRVQLTSTPGLDLFPRVTRDGRVIVFASDRDGSVRAWRMALDGSGAKQVTSEPIGRHRVALSSDDKWIYYDNTRGESRRVSIDGGEAQPTVTADVVAKLSEPLPRGFHEAMASPDGAFIAGHYSTPTGERMMLVPTAGGPLRKLETMPPNATWAPDGKSLIFYSGRGGTFNLLRQPVSGGAAAPLTQFTSEQIFTYALSPDQKQLAVVRGRVSSDVVLVSSVEKSGAEKK
jgi:Tol biopolymer transport system component